MDDIVKGNKFSLILINILMDQIWDKLSKDFVKRLTLDGQSLKVTLHKKDGDS